MNQQNDYQFIKVPVNLFYLMDANCSKVLTTLIQMDSFYPKTDGYFECAYKTLEQACGISQNLIKASLAGLYLEGLVDIISVGKGRGKHTNRYKINVERFQDYENTPVGIAMMTEDKPIHQVKYYGTRFKLPWENEKKVSTTIAQETAQSIAQGTAQNLTTNIDNVNNIENIKNIDNINNNIENNNNIIYMYNEMDITNNSTEEKDYLFEEEERNCIDIDYSYSISKKEEEQETAQPPCSPQELLDIYNSNFNQMLNLYPDLNYNLVLTEDYDGFEEAYNDIVKEYCMKVKQQSHYPQILPIGYLKMLNKYMRSGQ